jgi:uncharacterized protein (TIGR03437 family)
VPAIARVSATNPKVGTTLTITGTNLGDTTSVTFGGVPAKFKAVSPSKLKLTVPAKARSGSLTVTNPSGTATYAITIRA